MVRICFDYAPDKRFLILVPSLARRAGLYGGGIVRGNRVGEFVADRLRVKALLTETGLLKNRKQQPRERDRQR
ncbi:MAG TPA: hypothetical protein VN285_04320 [Candidatus Deferrimicrobium sp.]|nr:hypothetical protein [Candidatus Deferrimicrobium sp.]